MTEPRIERRVYKQDNLELFGQIETLVLASQLDLELDGVQYNIARSDNDAAGYYYRLIPHGLARGVKAARNLLRLVRVWL